MREVVIVTKVLFNGMEVFPERLDDGSLKVWLWLENDSGYQQKVNVLPVLTEEEYEYFHNRF